MAKPTPTVRPGAGGHRFGPDLVCSDCGRNWDDHQHAPAPCTHESRAEASDVGSKSRPTIEWITVGVPGSEEVADDEADSDDE